LGGDALGRGLKSQKVKKSKSSELALAAPAVLHFARAVQARAATRRDVDCAANASAEDFDFSTF